MSESNDSRLLDAPKEDTTSELPIRDAIQSHQTSVFSTNDYGSPSVFASVSPDSPPMQVPMNHNHGTSSNDSFVGKGNDPEGIEQAIGAPLLSHPSREVSSLSLSTFASNDSTLEPQSQVSMSQKTSTKQKKRRRQNATSSNRSNGTEHLSSSSGRWTVAEHHAFVRGLAIYGREWKRVAQDIPTRTSAQVRSHAQKYFTKVEKQMSSNSIARTLEDPHRGTAAAPKTRNHSLSSYGSNSYSSTEEVDLNNDATMNDGYITMSDSVRMEAARILANPSTVELEVRDTLERLRIRYRQLKERLEAQQKEGFMHSLSPNVSPQVVRNVSNGNLPSVMVVQEDDELIALHVLQELQKESQGSSHKTQNETK